MTTEVVPLRDVKLRKLVRKAFKNWNHVFREEFDENTRLGVLTQSTIGTLAVCREDMSFYLYDLIMNLRGLGSGLEFYLLDGTERLKVLDVYLFVLDRIRFEAMKRLGWLESYPGEDLTIVEMVLKYDEIHTFLDKVIPVLSSNHEYYHEYFNAPDYEREGIVRKLIPNLIRVLEDKKF